MVVLAPIAAVSLWLGCCLCWLGQVERGPFRILSEQYGLSASRGSEKLKVVPESVPWSKMVAMAADYGPSVHVIAFGMRFRLPVASGTLEIGWPTDLKFPRYPKNIVVKWSGPASAWPLHRIARLSWDHPAANLASNQPSVRLRRRHWLLANHLLYVSVPTSGGQLTISGTGDSVPPRFYGVAETHPHSNAAVTGAWPAVSPPWVAAARRDITARRRRVVDILEQAGWTPWTAASVSATAFKDLKAMDAEEMFQTAVGIFPRRRQGSCALRIAAILTVFPNDGPYCSRIIRCADTDGTLYICRASGRHANAKGFAEGYDDWRWLFFGPKGNCLSFGDVGCRKGASEDRVVAKTAALAGFTHGVPKPLPSAWGASVPRRAGFFSCSEDENAERNLPRGLASRGLGHFIDRSGGIVRWGDGVC